MRRFGTDGIRGVANDGLSAEVALAAGRAVGAACREGTLGSAPVKRPSVVLGRDTRPSGPMIEGALVAGLCSAGCHVLRAGVLPTPAVAHLVARHGAQAGIVVSASHNPPADNGIKVFGPGGAKLPAAAEDALEALLDAPADRTRADVGTVRDLEGCAGAYLGHLLDGAPRLDGLRVVVDCAHGAAYDLGPRALRQLGADVIAIHDTPDGSKINEACGATHPDVVAHAARRHGCVGLTFDGDADRVLAADESGNIVDGDAILALLARHLRAEGRLHPPRVVVTVMANQAFRMWAGAEGFELVETPVGDRYVLEAMSSAKARLGGEQSGHVVIADRSSTGDGILTALHLLEVVKSGGGKLAPLVPFRPFPQVLVNVPAAGTVNLDDWPDITEAVRRAEDSLGPSGRVLIRSSGTQPLVRVMVEAPTTELAERLATELADAVALKVRAPA